MKKIVKICKSCVINCKNSFEYVKIFFVADKHRKFIACINSYWIKHYARNTISDDAFGAEWCLRSFILFIHFK